MRIRGAGCQADVRDAANAARLVWLRDSELVKLDRAVVADSARNGHQPFPHNCPAQVPACLQGSSSTGLACHGVAPRVEIRNLTRLGGLFSEGQIHMEAGVGEPVAESLGGRCRPLPTTESWRPNAAEGLAWHLYVLAGAVGAWEATDSQWNLAHYPILPHSSRNAPCDNG